MTSVVRFFAAIAVSTMSKVAPEDMEVDMGGGGVVAADGVIGIVVSEEPLIGIAIMLPLLFLPSDISYLDRAS